MAKRKRYKTVYGVGTVDVDHVVHKTINGKVKFCKIYKTWSRMLERCYSKRCLEKNPTYQNCKVCDEWLLFSNFKKWMEQQDWQGKVLDKDLLHKGNKVYSPDKCIFVPIALNSFVTDSGAIRGALPIGVHAQVKNGNTIYVSRCQNPFLLVREHLGCFKCPKEAHLAWKKRKNELANEWAKRVSDERLADSLRKRYS